MCNIAGKIITVQEANLLETRRSWESKDYAYYWRTNQGELREFGYVLSCKCGNSKFFARTKKQLRQDWDIRYG